MIWPTDAYLLARTKLKTRRIRLIVTVIITSLLFSVLAFIASFLTGTVHSLKSFSSEGYGNKFYIQAVPLAYGNNNGPTADPDPVLLAKQKNLIARKKALAKKLDLTYDDKNDQNLPLMQFQNPGSPVQYFPNFAYTDNIKATDIKNKSIPGTSFEEFTKLVHRAGGANTYQGTQSGGLYSADPGLEPPQISVLRDGHEDLTSLTTGRNSQPETTGVASIMTVGWRSADTTLIVPFILPGQTLVTGKDGSVPVVAPFSAAEQILGLKGLPQTATAEQKLARLTQVRKAVAGKTAQLCYRNTASFSLLNEAARQIKEVADNKNNKDYTKPSLLYALPTTPCGEVPIKSDTRTADEKKAAANQKQFDDEFGLTKTPEQGLVTIRIVGMNPDLSYGPSISPAAILTSLFTSSVGSGWLSPTKSVASNELANKIQGGTATTAFRSKVIYYAQFDSLAKMQAFVKSQACDNLQNVAGPGGTPITIDTSQGGTNTQNCIKQAKVYNVSPYGNSAGAVEQVRATIWKVGRYIIAVIVFIAALIMMGNVGKIIADSRRETAVFRALGAKRLDIIQIYVTYTILVSLLVAFTALVLGTVASLVLNSHFSADISVAAVLAYNAQDVHKQFLLTGFSPQYTLVIIGLTLLAGLLSALLPLVANTRRNPIRDMRDDT